MPIFSAFIYFFKQNNCNKIIGANNFFNSSVTFPKFLYTFLYITIVIKNGIFFIQLTDCFNKTFKT